MWLTQCEITLSNCSHSRDSLPRAFRETNGSTNHWIHFIYLSMSCYALATILHTQINWYHVMQQHNHPKLYVVSSSFSSVEIMCHTTCQNLEVLVRSQLVPVFHTNGLLHMQQLSRQQYAKNTFSQQTSCDTNNNLWIALSYSDSIAWLVQNIWQISQQQFCQNNCPRQPSCGTNSGSS